jgi:hypothetical protein
MLMSGMQRLMDEKLTGFLLAKRQYKNTRHKYDVLYFTFHHKRLEEEFCH